jgi:8-oxo-dGTP pyrophosphatase MutT (NUDIX family)
VPPLSDPFRPDAPIAAEIASGAVVIHADDGTAFLLHQPDEDRWCLPKGHVDPGESLATAALREIREETGFKRVVLGEEILEVNYRFYQPRRARNVHKTVIYFLARTDERVPRLESLFDRSEWLPLPDAERRVTYDLDRAVVAAAAAHLRSSGFRSAERKRGKG